MVPLGLWPSPAESPMDWCFLFITPHFTKTWFPAGSPISPTLLFLRFPKKIKGLLFFLVLLLISQLVTSSPKWHLPCQWKDAKVEQEVRWPLSNPPISFTCFSEGAFEKGGLRREGRRGPPICPSLGEPELDDAPCLCQEPQPWWCISPCLPVSSAQLRVPMDTLQPFCDCLGRGAKAKPFWQRFHNKFLAPRERGCY